MIQRDIQKKAQNKYNNIIMRFIISLSLFFILTTRACCVCMGDGIRQLMLAEYARIARIQGRPESNLLCVVREAQKVPLTKKPNEDGEMVDCTEESHLQNAILYSLGVCYDEMEPIDQTSLSSDDDDDNKSSTDIETSEISRKLKQTTQRETKSETTDENITVHARRKAVDPNCFTGKHGCCNVFPIGIAPRCFDLYCPDFKYSVLCL